MPIETVEYTIKGGLIIATVKIFGIRQSSDIMLRLALDTGSTKTVIKPETIAALGYSEKNKTKNVGVTTGTKTEKAYQLNVESFEFLNFKWENPSVIVKELPISLFFIDGLLGLDFFEGIGRKLTIDFGDKTISLG